MEFTEFTFTRSVVATGPSSRAPAPIGTRRAASTGSAIPPGPTPATLPNVTVAANGVLSTIVTVPGANLGGPDFADADGAALVLHASADDNVTDPSGNSGDRIACAILVPSR